MLHVGRVEKKDYFGMGNISKLLKNEAIFKFKTFKFSIDFDIQGVHIKDGNEILHVPLLCILIWINIRWFMFD